MRPRFTTRRAEAPWADARRPSLWLAAPLAILLAGGAMFGIHTAANSLADSREAARYAGDLADLVTATRATEAARTGPNPGSELDAGAAIVRLEPAIVALEQMDSSARSSAVRAAFERVKEDVAAGEQAILTGRRDAAEVNATVGASNQAFGDAIATAANALKRDAESAQRWFTILTAAIFSVAGVAFAGLVALFGLQREAAATLRNRSEAHFRAMTQHSGEVISLVDDQGLVQSQSSSLLRLLGRSDLWLVGRPFTDIVELEDRAHLLDLLRTATLRPGEPAYGRLRLTHSDGSPRMVDVTAVRPTDQFVLDGVLLTCRIVPEEPAAVPAAAVAETPAATVQHPVSGLLTEPLFRDRLAHALSRSVRSADPVALLILDLGAEQAFAALSEDAQASTLRAITGRVARSVRGGDTIAHLRGMEFAVILEQTDLDAARLIAQRIYEQLQPPVAHLNGRIRLTPRIGIAVKTDPRDSVDTLLLDARTAVSEPELWAAATAAVPEPERSAAAESTAQPAVQETATAEAPGDQLIVSNVPDQDQAALAEPPATDAPGDDRFEFQFIPVLALETGEVVELEAVVRWSDPQHGQVPVEQSGKTDAAFGWMLEQAGRLAPTLPITATGRPVLLSLNVSPRTPLDDVLVDRVASALLASGLEPGALQLEIAARALDADGDPAALDTLRELRALGVRLALDGAGAEAGRLPDFDRLPVDAVKIDRSVVTLLDRSADRRALVRSLVEQAHAKGVTVTGVGIETLEQAERLWDLGADAGQGPLFFRPVEEAQLPALFGSEPALVAAD